MCVCNRNLADSEDAMGRDCLRLNRVPGGDIRDESVACESSRGARRGCRSGKAPSDDVCCTTQQQQQRGASICGGNVAVAFARVDCTQPRDILNSRRAEWRLLVGKDQGTHPL